MRLLEERHIALMPEGQLKQLHTKRVLYLQADILTRLQLLRPMEQLYTTSIDLLTQEVARGIVERYSPIRDMIMQIFTLI